MACGEIEAEDLTNNLIQTAQTVEVPELLQLRCNFLVELGDS